MTINKPCYKTLSAIRSNKTFPSTVIILLISMSSLTILYKLFFHFSTIIWSINTGVSPEDLTPHARNGSKPEGIEVYCLYVLVLACIFLSFFLLAIYRLLLSFSEYFVCKIAYWIFLFTLFLNAFLFFGNIGFYPSMCCAILDVRVYLLIIILSPLIYFLLKVLVRFEKISFWVVPIILIPFCFIATAPMAIYDYSFIFSPALRIVHHFKFSEIYFQYDLLLSLLAALWMKFDLDLNYFQILGQFSLYAFFLFSFFFSRRIFLRKELSFYLLAGLVLIRVYANFADPVVCFQTTPLRLDWWLLLLILAYEKGLYSKYMGFSLGLLIVFHRTFGLIYAVCYLEAVFMLLLFDFIKNIVFAGSFKASIQKHLKFNFLNVGIIVLSLGLSSLVFGPSVESVSTYQKLGFAFLKISKISFYWYVPILLSSASIYLLRARGKVPDRYFTAGLLLVFLAVGNSIYFFGRSHENNIINISGSLIFTLFMLFDLLSLKYCQSKENNRLKILLVGLLPIIFLLLLFFYYSGKIYMVTSQKLNNMKNLQFVYPMPLSFDMKSVKELTNNSPNVYFLGGEYDFYYYYYGGYVPQGRFSPYVSWVYKKELVDFLQALLDKGYYIVSLRENNRNPKVYNEVLSCLKYDEIVEKQGFKVLYESKH